MTEVQNGVVKRDENARHNLPLNNYARAGLAFVELDLKWSPEAFYGRCKNLDAQLNIMISMVWMVEPGGIEPPTSCMPCKRSTN
jgi:hypothetical protein